MYIKHTQSTSETTGRQRLRGQPNLTLRSSALLPVRIKTSHRPDHIRLSALVRSRSTHFIVHASSQLGHAGPWPPETRSFFCHFGGVFLIRPQIFRLSVSCFCFPYTLLCFTSACCILSYFHNMTDVHTYAHTSIHTHRHTYEDACPKTRPKKRRTHINTRTYTHDSVLPVPTSCPCWSLLCMCDVGLSPFSGVVCDLFLR